MKTLTISFLSPVAVFVGLLLTLAGSAQAAPDLFTLVTTTPRTLTSATLAVAQKTDSPGQVSADKKSLAFRQTSIRLVAVTGPSTDMLSYRIAGLRNPTLVVPRGATLHILFVNTDDDMTHNLRFAAQGAPAGGADRPMGTADLPHKSGMAYHAEDLTVRPPAHAGAYTYLCTVPGHAPGGMRGTLLVR